MVGKFPFSVVLLTIIVVSAPVVSRAGLWDTLRENARINDEIARRQEQADFRSRVEREAAQRDSAVRRNDYVLFDRRNRLSSELVAAVSRDRQLIENAICSGNADKQNRLRRLVRANPMFRLVPMVSDGERISVNSPRYVQNPVYDLKSYCGSLAVPNYEFYGVSVKNEQGLALVYASRFVMATERTTEMARQLIEVLPADFSPSLEATDFIQRAKQSTDVRIPGDFGLWVQQWLLQKAASMDMGAAFLYPFQSSVFNDGQLSANPVVLSVPGSVICLYRRVYVTRQSRWPDDRFGAERSLPEDGAVLTSVDVTAPLGCR